MLVAAAALASVALALPLLRVLVVAATAFTGFAPSAIARGRGGRLAAEAAGQAQVVQPSTPSNPDEEAQVWQEAYDLESDRSELIAAQIASELGRVTDLSNDLREEFEGCVVDLEPPPSRPVSQAAAEWASAYMAIRRCNEQSELRLNELRGKIQARGVAAEQALKPEVTMDFGPIRHMGITFKGITFRRFGFERGSQIFFLELPMPLGIRLEETAVALRNGGAGRAVEVAEIVDGGNIRRDGRVREGDFLRAITVPQRRLSRSGGRGGEEEVGTLADVIGVGAGTLEKALLVIPTESSFPFEQVLEDLQRNSQVDGYVGMVFERPFE